MYINRSAAVTGHYQTVFLSSLSSLIGPGGPFTTCLLTRGKSEAHDVLEKSAASN